MKTSELVQGMWVISDGTTFSGPDVRFSGMRGEVQVVDYRDDTARVYFPRVARGTATWIYANALTPCFLPPGGEAADDPRPPSVRLTLEYQEALTLLDQLSTVSRVQKPAVGAFRDVLETACIREAKRLRREELRAELARLQAEEDEG